MRTTRSVFFVLAWSAWLSGSAAGAAEPRIRNGLETADFATTAALLDGDSASVATQRCTGTLVGCETFVTAAHCVCDVDGASCDPDASRYFVHLQHAGVFAVDAITPHPDYDTPSDDYDVAVLHLAAPVTGIAPTRLADTPPVFDTGATIVGYGLDDELSEPDRSGLKRFGKVVTEDCDPLPQMSNDQHVCWTFDPPHGAAGEDSNACPGDSGAPLLVGPDPTAALAGVTSFGFGATACSDGSTAAANVALFADFIESAGGADLAAGACGDVAAIGGANAVVHGFDGDIDAGTPDGLHTFDVPAGTRELRITLNATEGGAADFDLFARAGAAPDPEGGLFDCRSANATQFETCRFTDPAPGTWYALARRFQGAGTYQVTASVLGAPGVCGDGTVDPGEGCDDGNTVAGDGCSALCVDETLPLCGDGILQTGEACDDGNTVAGDGCSATCTVELSACPAWPAQGCETASRKTKLNMQWAKNKLIWQWRDLTTVQSFGDPTTTTDYRLCIYDQAAGIHGLALEAAIPNGDHWTEKRNGFRLKSDGTSLDGIRKAQLKNRRRAKIKFTGIDMEFPERLEQANQVVVQLGSSEGSCWQGCYEAPAKRNDAAKFVDDESFGCVIPPAPACGDGTLDSGEACDDGNTVAGDGCSEACTLEVICGDGVIEGSEACDDGNTVAGDGCSETCAIEAICGDGATQGAEECDDGNTIDDDACGNDCTLPVCGDGVVEGAEACDDGNTVAADGCEDDCTVTVP